MALFLEQQSIYADPDFQKRVKHAIVKVAIAVRNEAASENPDLDARRSRLALAVLDNADVYGPRFAQSVVTNQAITSASSDADIEFTVSSVWNAFAG